jgi:hypothetical protein
VKTTIFCVLLLFLYVGVNAQKAPKKNQKISLYLKEFGLSMYIKKVPDTIRMKIDDSTSIKVYIKDRKGASSFFIYDVRNRAVIKGQYSNALKLSRMITDSFSASGDLLKSKIVWHFEPVSSGTWSFYNKGILFKEKKYRKGVLIDSVMFK